MIFPQERWNPTVTKRFRPICGPFQADEEELFHRVAEYLRRSGARILSVGENAGVTIYRLRSECESIEQTRSRLRKRR